MFTALTRDINPPSNVERIDPKTLHLSGEFAEQNLGTSVAPDGSVTTRDHCNSVHVRAALHCGAAGTPRDPAVCDT